MIIENLIPAQNQQRNKIGKREGFLILFDACSHTNDLAKMDISVYVKTESHSGTYIHSERKIFCFHKPHKPLVEESASMEWVSS